MGRRGRPTKFTLTYEQKVWDNYSPYFPMKEPTAKELEQHYNEKHLMKMEKALTKICDLAGYQPNKGLITSISKRLLDTV
jgi:hypothetical protein